MRCRRILVVCILSVTGTLSGQDLKICSTTNPGKENSGLRLAGSTNKLWPPGQTLKIMFLGGSNKLQGRVEKAALEWTKFANVNFDFIPNGRSDLRIAFLQGQGSWSAVGTDALQRPQSDPTMNFGWFDDNTSDVEIKRTTLHEFGHALGMIHEHQSPDANIPWNKPKVYEYYRLTQTPPWDMNKVDFNIFQTYSASNTNFSSFDPNSIMLYPIPNEHTIGDFEIKSNTSLSDVDKTHISKLYPGRWNNINKITLDTLTCHVKQEASANDEIHIRIFADGKPVPIKHPDRLFLKNTPIFNMRQGETENLNLPVTFKRSLKVEVWELDNPDLGDDHDLFGCATITSSGAGKSIIALKHNRFGIRQHKYTLTWK